MISLGHSLPDKTVSDNASVEDIKKLIKDLYTSKDTHFNSISLTNDTELFLEIYKGAIVLTDWGGFSYDGPGGAGELVSVRVEEWVILGVIEKVVDLLEGFETEELVKLLKSLPKQKK